MAAIRNTSVLNKRGQLLLVAALCLMEDILHAAGADEVITIQRYAHLVGGARMARDQHSGVVDQFCRSFAVPNLYITDGSVLPTQGAANPALTIMTPTKPWVLAAPAEAR